MTSVLEADKRFKIDWMTLGNYRQFRFITFLPSTFNVIVGVNGAGKTTLLQALADVFHSFSEYIVTGDLGSWRPRTSDTKIGFQSVSIMLSLTADGETFLGGVIGDVREGNVDASDLDIDHSDLEHGSLPTGGTIFSLADKYRDRLSKDAGTSLPIVALYSVNRIDLDIPAKSEDRHAFDQQAAYEGALESQRDFRAFFEWFRERQDAENDLRLDDPEHRDAQLQAVRRATEVLMDGYRDLRVRHTPLRMTLKKGQEELTTDQLSGGEKALLALVGDLEGPEPHSLTVWRTAGNTVWDVPGDVKEDIRHGLWTEQSGLCAFCCAKLPTNPLLQRIAHVEPRKVNPNRSLDFSNMVASCSSGLDKMPDGAMSPKELSCDENQGSRELPVHPLQADCMAKFVYLGNGAIRSSTGGNDAQETIDILNLDCVRLRSGRMAAIRGALIMKDRMKPDDWDRIYRNPVSPYGREFWPAIAGQP